MNEPDPNIQIVIATLDNIKSAEDEGELKILHEAIQQIYALPPHAEQAL